MHLKLHSTLLDERCQQTGYVIIIIFLLLLMFYFFTFWLFIIIVVVVNFSPDLDSPHSSIHNHYENK